MALLEIRNLTVEFPTFSGPFKAVDGVDLEVDQGDVVAIVGESGSGKSVLMLAVMGLLPGIARISADRLTFGGQNLLGLSAGARRRIIGKDMAMIFQEPMTSLNPCFTVAFQLTEAIKVHEGGGRAERRRRALELLDQVGIPAPAERLGAFPHQLSGGMSQRVMIAMAIACNPRLLIADEPTTALDVTIQAQILDLLLELQQKRGMALILITHDMGVVAETARRVVVQYAGQQAEMQDVPGPVRRSPAPVHGGPPARPARALPRAPPADHRRPRAGRRRSPVGLPVPPALRVRDRALHRRGTALRQRPARPGPLPLPPDRRAPGRPSPLCAVSRPWLHQAAGRTVTSRRTPSSAKARSSWPR